MHSCDHKQVENSEGGFLHMPGLYGQGAKTDRIYGSSIAKNPRVRFKENHQMNKVPEILARQNGKVDHAIWGASVTDITNLKKQYQAAMRTPNDGVFASKEKAEVYQAAAQSSLNSIQVAEEALEANPNNKKIIKLERPPRYDELKELNKLSNLVLRDRAPQTRNQGQLVVGEHIMLDCHGARRTARYGKPGGTKGYDRVHFRTAEGRKAFTASVIRILKNEAVASVEEECPEWQVVGGRSPARRMKPQETFSVPTENRLSPLS